MLVATIYSVPLVLLYLQTGRVEEGMIYRILAIVSFSVAGVMLIGVGILMDRVSQVVHAGTRKRSRITESVDRLFSPANCLRFSLPFLIGAMASLFSSVVQYMLFGKVLEHWSQIALGMFCTLLGFVFITLYLMGVAIGVLESHQEYRK